MKAYRITDDIKIVRYGNMLRFEVCDKVVDDIGADDVSQIIDMLFDVHHGASGNRLWVKSDGHRKSLNIVYDEDDDSLDVFIQIEGATDRNKSAELNSRWIRLKFIQVLTALLVKLCEEGV